MGIFKEMYMLKEGDVFQYGDQVYTIEAIAPYEVIKKYKKSGWEKRAILKNKFTHSISIDDFEKYALCVTYWKRETYYYRIFSKDWVKDKENIMKVIYKG